MVWFFLRLIYKLRYDNEHLSLAPCLDGSAMSVSHTLPQDPLCPALPSASRLYFCLLPLKQGNKYIFHQLISCCTKRMVHVFP